MSFTSRLRVILRSKSDRALTRLEDPREALDDSYEQQLKMLQQVRHGLAEVATAKKRIELLGQEMGGRYRRLADQAQEAVNQGRDDLARTALERRSLLEGQVAGIREQYLALVQQQSQLQENERRLTERIAVFRTEKETMKATYAASQARVKANEGTAGLGSEITDAGAGLDRARDRVAQMRARAAATDELLSSGALHDVTAAPDSDLERQLSAGATKADVDRQLQAMKDVRTGDGGRGTGSGSDTRAGTDARGGSGSWLSIGEGPTAL